MTTATTTVTLASGDEFTVPSDLVGHADDERPRFVGVSVEGYTVVEAYGLTYGLTPCCGVSAKGSMANDDEPAIVCRSCYADVDPLLGGSIEVDDAYQPAEDGIPADALAEVLDAAQRQVDHLRLTARECRRDGADRAAAPFDVKASILADAIDRVRASA